jgi:hypothetical protein
MTKIDWKSVTFQLAIDLLGADFVGRETYASLLMCLFRGDTIAHRSGSVYLRIINDELEYYVYGNKIEDSRMAIPLLQHFISQPDGWGTTKKSPPPPNSVNDFSEWGL